MSFDPYELAFYHAMHQAHHAYHNTEFSVAPHLLTHTPFIFADRFAASRPLLAFCDLEKNVSAQENV